LELQFVLVGSALWYMESCIYEIMWSNLKSNAQKSVCFQMNSESVRV